MVLFVILVAGWLHVALVRSSGGKGQTPELMMVELANTGDY
jgi:hypothetical protein